MVCDKMLAILFLITVATVNGSPPPKETFKDQFCTDPRTMQKHAAYTEWADAYSCTRHRCQPGGRNLAIYTVGCKRVEAPESAIECEEVVEDTNMQFPFCCTRLRCLVVVRGEVWTRVLGQPWETLPAAPWSHMYKMKKPPPGETAFLPKSPGEGPVFELSSDATGEAEKVLRSGKKLENPDCNEVVPRASAAPTPDIVIALSTTTNEKDHKKSEKGRSRHKRGRKLQMSPFFDEDNTEQQQQQQQQQPQQQQQNNEVELEDTGIEKEKPIDAASDEKIITNSFGVTQKAFKASAHHQSWTEIPPSLWNDHEPPMGEPDTTVRDGSHSPDFTMTPEEKRDEKPSNLQALVDAIGTRMRDIENVVQKMSEKVHKVKPGQTEYSGEKKSEAEILAPQDRKHHKADKENRTKRPSPDGDQYKRQEHLLHPAYDLTRQNDEFSVRNRGSKYLHTTETTTEQPIFVEDNNLNGYFSDASNNLIRRSNPPKEPAPVYTAPVENRRKASHIVVSETSEDSAEKKHKKHMHKKKKNKGKTHKKHHKEEKKKRVSKLNSIELEKNVVSLEDSSAVGST